MTVSSWHVIWAYEDHICDKWSEGLSVRQIRAWLRDDCHLHVGESAIRDVLKANGAAVRGKAL